AHNLSAQYGGDSNFTGSTSPSQPYSVNVASSATTLGTSGTPSVYGQPVTFNVSVTSSAGIPAGPVNRQEGAATLGTATLDPAGNASFVISNLPLGSHNLTAEFVGNSNFTGSTSSIRTQVINPASSNTGLSSSTLAAVFGQPVTFTATVTAAGPSTGTPTG